MNWKLSNNAQVAKKYKQGPESKVVLL